MRKTACSIAALVLAGFAAGCATAPPPPVAVMGAPGDLIGVAGQWGGEYWSAATGRRGTIRFVLQADTGAAWGEVWMFPAEPHAAEAGRGPGRRGAEPLQVRFVRVGPGSALSGTIDPYRDPECDCMLSTTFVGELAGDDRIEGTYTTRGGVAHGVTTGRWEVRRVAEPAS